MGYSPWGRKESDTTALIPVLVFKGLTSVSLLFA